MHLLALAANSNAVMVVLLKATGHADLVIGLRLREIEEGLENALTHVRSIRMERRSASG